MISFIVYHIGFKHWACTKFLLERKLVYSKLYQIKIYILISLVHTINYVCVDCWNFYGLISLYCLLMGNILCIYWCIFIFIVGKIVDCLFFLYDNPFLRTNERQIDDSDKIFIYTQTQWELLIRQGHSSINFWWSFYYRLIGLSYTFIYKWFLQS